MSDILKKAQQLSIQFSCRIPLKTELKPSEKESIKAYLQDTDPDHFQIFDAPLQGPVPPGLFHVFRQYNMSGGAIATGPTFIFARDSIAILTLIKAGESTFRSPLSLQASDQNKKMETILFKITELVKGLRFNRAGKIFELVFPFSPADKQTVLKRLLADTSSDISGVQLIYNRIQQDSSGKKININTQAVFQQMKLEDPLNLMVKVDINNHDLQNIMDPREVTSIWKEADSLIESHLESIIP